MISRKIVARVLRYMGQQEAINFRDKLKKLEKKK